MKYSLWLSVGLTAIASTTFADPLTTGFESPEFALGSTLTSATGWTPLATGMPAGIIQNSIVFSGSQAVQLMRPAEAAGTYGALYTNSSLPADAAHPVISIEWNMYALDAPQRSEVWGVSSMWGTDVERMTVGINGNNKLIIRNGQIGTVVTNVSIARNTWNKYRMDLNFLMDKGAIYFNNNFVGEWAMTAGPDQNFDIALFNRFGGNDGAVYDGLSVTGGAAPVPEPASILATAVGVGALLRRKRNQL